MLSIDLMFALATALVVHLNNILFLVFLVHSKQIAKIPMRCRHLFNSQESMYCMVGITWSDSPCSTIVFPSFSKLSYKLWKSKMIGLKNFNHWTPRTASMPPSGSILKSVCIYHPAPFEPSFQFSFLHPRQSDHVLMVLGLSS